MKNNKGITLISLIASIILLFILAATTISTSMNAYKQMKFEGAKAELEEVQKLLDELVSDYKTYTSEVGGTPTYAAYLDARFNETVAANKFSNKQLSTHSGDIAKLKAAHTEIDPNSPSAFYLTGDDLVKYFGLKGIDTVVVEFSTKKAYSVNGIKDSADNTTVYYTPSDWSNKKKDISNKPEDLATSPTEYAAQAEKKASREGEISFYKKGDTTKKKVNISVKVTEIYIQKSSETKWTKTSSFRDISSAEQTLIRFTVDTAATYNVKIVDSAKNIYTITGISLS